MKTSIQKKINLSVALADGSLDTSFDPGPGPVFGGIFSMALQSDGKIIIGWDFTNYNVYDYDGIDRNRIARLNTDGVPDSTFDPGAGADQDVLAIAIQSNGRIIIGWSFTSYNWTDKGFIARIYGTLLWCLWGESGVINFNA